MYRALGTVGTTRAFVAQFRIRIYSTVCHLYFPPGPRTRHHSPFLFLPRFVLVFRTRDRESIPTMNLVLFEVTVSPDLVGSEAGGG